ncbi:MAG: 2-oxo acid dehydrogenase subunit E2 [Bacteroidia bacterium]|nr:2-oxo acid dehydrogenase subunit E2 [Bacteroidia bacterium]
MARVEMVMPKMGESIMEATILKWTKKIGDVIETDESILEIATDKVDSEVPSPSGGTLAEILFPEGAVVPVGTVIAVLETNATNNTASKTNTKPELTTNKEVISKIASSSDALQPVLTNLLLEKPQSGRFYSPLVMNIAKEEGISTDELDRIPGTGNEGRVTKKDILQYLELKKAGNLTGTNASTVPPVIQLDKPVNNTQKIVTESVATPVSTPKKSFSFNGNFEIIEMDRMRKVIAENMLYSKQTSPHVTSFVEADVTNLVLWREKNKSIFEKKYGEKLTFTPMFVEAVCKAIRDLPMVNISVDGDKIIVKKDINIGVAVALPTNNLIVPTLRRADKLNLAGLAASVNDLANRARINKLSFTDLEDGTFTISNVGTFGNVMGTPIIMQPQCAVLATGAIRKKPAVLETPTGDVIAIRHLMFLSHSYDHRVIDGALGGTFVRRVADYLEAWDINREV